MEAWESSRLASSGPPGMLVDSSPNGKVTNSSASVYHGDGSSEMTLGSGLGFMGKLLKKKRGQPKKHECDGTTALCWTPSFEPPSKCQGYSPMSGSTGIAFSVHIITVNPGEDVTSKIMSFSQQGPHTVCILSANGAISNVTLQQPATFGGTVIYEGFFEILSLSGSFLPMENGTTPTRTGGLSVALAGSDGGVVGGGISGMLMAATPVQVIMGSFMAETRPDPSKHEPSSAPPQMAPCVSGASPSPPSEGTSLELFEDDPVRAGACYNINHQVPRLSEYISFGWSHSANH